MNTYSRIRVDTLLFTLGGFAEEDQHHAGHQQPWTPADDAYLRRHYGTVQARVIADYLGRSRLSVVVRVSLLRKKGHDFGPKWRMPDAIAA